MNIITNLSCIIISLPTYHVLSFFTFFIWFVVDLPLWKMMEFVRLDHHPIGENEIHRTTWHCPSVAGGFATAPAAPAAAPRATAGGAPLRRRRCGPAQRRSPGCWGGRRPRPFSMEKRRDFTEKHGIKQIYEELWWNMLIYDELWLCNDNLWYINCDESLCFMEVWWIMLIYYEKYIVFIIRTYGHLWGMMFYQDLWLIYDLWLNDLPSRNDGLWFSPCQVRVLSTI